MLCRLNLIPAKRSMNISLNFARIDNLPTLKGDGNPARARANRTAFNQAVLAQLKALQPKKAGS
jgi:hypothetical protein